MENKDKELLLEYLNKARIFLNGPARHTSWIVDDYFTEPNDTDELPYFTVFNEDGSADMLFVEDGKVMVTQNINNGDDSRTEEFSLDQFVQLLESKNS